MPGTLSDQNARSVGITLDESPSGGNVPVGGTAGQTLFKNSNVNFDTGWASVEGVEVVAQDTLNAFDPVTITGRLANSSNPTHYGRVVGLIKDNLAVGFSGAVIDKGLITNPLWSWSPGADIFLNGTTLSQSAPSTGFTQQIGVAKTSTTLYVNLGTPLLL